jgi:hypothetical protein
MPVNMDILAKFILACKKSQAGRQSSFKQEFQEIILSPPDPETLLQAFLFFNADLFFPECTDLLMYEQTPNLSNQTQLGKCDFVCLTKRERVIIIETKFIDYNDCGSTARKRRNKHQNKVINQVLGFRSKISEYWSIPIEIIDCGVFTTKDLSRRGEYNSVIAKHISIDALNIWQQEEKNKIEEKVKALSTS